MPEERDDQIRQRPPGVRKPVIKIQNYVRRHTNPVDIETLHSKGFKKVNLITLSKINKLIAYAVERTFEKYSDSLGGVGAKKIEAEVESVVRRRLQELQNPQSAQQPDEIEAAEPEAPEHGDAAARPPAPPQASPEPADTPSSPSQAATEGPPQDPADGPAQAIQTTHPAATAADTASEAVREQAPAPPPRSTAAARPAAPPASPPASLRDSARNIAEDIFNELEPRIRALIIRTLQEQRLALQRGGDPLAPDLAMNIRRGFEDALSRALARQREIVGAPAARPDDSRSEILERRLDKLKRELLEMEIALERMASEKGIDPGLASIYREVQGLNQLDTHYEKKKGVLKGIFEANLKLQTPG